METARFMWRLIQDMKPDHKPPNLEQWANTIRLMREKDGRTDGSIRQVFQWANQHPFWFKNILSPGALRKQFDRLELDSRRQRHKPQSSEEQRTVTNQAAILGALSRRKEQTQIVDQSTRIRVIEAEARQGQSINQTSTTRTEDGESL